MRSVLCWKDCKWPVLNVKWVASLLPSLFVPARNIEDGITLDNQKRKQKFRKWTKRFLYHHLVPSLWPVLNIFSSKAEGEVLEGVVKGCFCPLFRLLVANSWTLLQPLLKVYQPRGQQTMEVRNVYWKPHQPLFCCAVNNLVLRWRRAWLIWFGLVWFRMNRFHLASYFVAELANWLA